jgi:hypothetical protein
MRQPAGESKPRKKRFQADQTLAMIYDDGATVRYCIRIYPPYIIWRYRVGRKKYRYQNTSHTVQIHPGKMSARG